ncbi:cytochrome P450 [Bradyrhizobium sp. USDA 4353]
MAASASGISPAAIGTSKMKPAFGAWGVPRRLGSLIVSPRAYARQKTLLSGLRWLRTHNPIGLVEVDGFDPFWIVTRHADVLHISQRHDHFRNGDRSHTLVPRASDEAARRQSNGNPNPIRTLVHMDEPDHAKYRQLTQLWFGPANMKALEHQIRIMAVAAIDRMAAHGSSCDFVRDVAVHYPLRVLMRILGVPAEDEASMLKLTQQLFASEDADLGYVGSAAGDPARHAHELHRLLGEFRDYFVPLLEKRRRAPANDLISVIANASVDGKPIDYFEAVSYYIILATAGHDTTSSSISGGLWGLCGNIGELQKVRDDLRQVPRLVEEAIRWTSPVQHVMRTAADDVTLQGNLVKKGDWLMLSYLSANRDESVFDEPDSFRINRDGSRSIVFGQGIHACLGQHLARIEMRIFFEELLARLTSVEITGRPQRSASLFIGGPKSLPIRFKLS